MTADGFDQYAMLRQLIDGEDERLLVYDDATGRPIVPGSHVIGHPTIGIGRALDVDGISRSESRAMAVSDISKYRIELYQHPWFIALDGVRQRVIVDMRHQLGLHGLLEFREMITAIGSQDWTAAAAAGLDSVWHEQTPGRAERLMAMLRTGEADTLA